MRKRCVTGLGLLIIILQFMSTLASAHDRQTGLANGQTVYVPAYSHIYSGNKEVPSFLAVTLSIRNTDPNHSIRILVVNYHETEGNLVKKLVLSPLTLSAMESTRYIIPQKDKAGGSGANFIVEWKSDRNVNVPIIETIMIGSRSSFTSRGQEIFPSE